MTGRRSPFRDRWLSVMLRSSRISCCVQVLLAVVYRDMDDAGLVKVVRDDLADLMGRSTRTITARLGEAVAAGYLERVRRGQKGQHAIYRAAIPTVSWTFSENPVVPAETAAQGTRELPAEIAVSENPVVPAYLGRATAYAFLTRSEPLAAPRVRLTGPIFASLPPTRAADMPQVDMPRPNPSDPTRTQGDQDHQESA